MKERTTGLTRGDKTRVDKFVRDLLTSGCGKRGERLVITDGEGRDLGGLCFRAIKSRLRDFVAATLKAERRDKRRSDGR